MTNWNNLFHSAEKPEESIQDKIPAPIIINVAGNITWVVHKLICNTDIKNKEGVDNFGNYIGRLSSQERRLVPECILRLTEFYEIIHDYDMKQKALDFIEIEFGTPIQRYDTSIK